MITLARRLRQRLTGFRPVSPADARRFITAVGGRRRRSACRAVLDGAFVTAVLKWRGLRSLLREMYREGLGATLHIGVRRGPNGIEAHAWVQVGDHVVNDDPEVVSGYVELSVGDAERYLPRLA